MDLLDELARPSNPLANVVTDFYFVSDRFRFWVVETGRPVKIVGGKVEAYNFDYTVSTWRATGWVEVIRVDQVHAETSMQAAQIAERILDA